MKRLAVVLAMLALAAAACAEPIGEGDPITTRPAGSGGTVGHHHHGRGHDHCRRDLDHRGGAYHHRRLPPRPRRPPRPPNASATMGVKVYFMLEGGGSDYRPGPFLVSVYREIPQTQQVAAAAMNALIAGPTADEKASVPALSSAVPADTMLLGISIDDGLATVDLSREFEAGGGTFSMAARLAQVVFTLTQFPTVAGSAVPPRRRGRDDLLQRGDHHGPPGRP